MPKADKNNHSIIGNLSGSISKIDKNIPMHIQSVPTAPNPSYQAQNSQHAKIQKENSISVIPHAQQIYFNLPNIPIQLK
jgi:hypothetical protein